ncbi:golgin subfamily A member 6-like protein 4 [Trichomycterus rosablanca]|uniref:golgin subfamily A member 6-like protein 4 n=1 Tax=Trichomycterus rosablanca TaxID=2290929 RepID=UPI002F34F05D
MSAEDNFEEACGSLLASKAKHNPLLTEEDDEDFFEDCMEEIEAALTHPENSITYSQKCKDALHAEFSGLMRQMLTQLDDFEATHETQSTPAFFTDSEDILKESAFQDTSKYGSCIAETAEFMAVDKSDDYMVEAPQLCPTMEIKEIGKTFEFCIEEVSRLERRREELVQELLELEKPMEEEVQVLRGKLGEAQKLLIQSRLQKQNLHAETLLFKRRLFAAARDCAQSQMALDIQQKEVEQLNQEQEEIKAHVVDLTEVITKLRSEHQSQLQALNDQKDHITQESSKDKTHSYLSQSRRASQDLQQYLQGEIKALEEWYEPRLVALLKRQQSSAEALSKYREQCQELKTKLEPLRDEEQKLALEKARLEERICLMERQRKENVEQYRKTINRLEESSRELKTELQLQIKKIKETEELKNSLAKQLFLYRQSIEGQHSQEIPLMEEKP